MRTISLLCLILIALIFGCTNKNSTFAAKKSTDKKTVVECSNYRSCYLDNLINTSNCMQLNTELLQKKCLNFNELQLFNNAFWIQINCVMNVMGQIPSLFNCQKLKNAKKWDSIRQNLIQIDVFGPKQVRIHSSEEFPS